jgi:hypothetical protein
MAPQQAHSAIVSWTRTLEASDALSREAMGRLIPAVYDAVEMSIKELRAGRWSNREATRLYGVLGKILSRIEHRIKRG